MQEKSELIQDLSSIIGEKYILTAEWSMEPIAKAGDMVKVKR